MKIYEPPVRSQIPDSLFRWYDKLRAEGHCRMCLRPDAVRPLTRHHLVPQRWFTHQKHDLRWALWRNVSANIIPLCRACHDSVEHEWDSRKMLRRLLTQEEIALAVALRGMDWLDHAYPRS